MGMLEQMQRMGWGAVLGLCLAGPCFAQRSIPVGDLAFERLDGLSHNTVLALLQDREGYLWIGTSDGLNRYDGYGVTVYRHRPSDSTSLANNTIKALLEDRAGHLWVGTDGGLHRFDRTTERFDRTPLGMDGLAPHREAVMNLVEDTAGYLWIGLQGYGLYRFEPTTGQVRTYLHAPGSSTGPADDTIWSLYQNQTGTLWVSAPDALYRYDAEADRFQAFPVPYTGDPFYVIHASEVGLWLSGIHGTRGFDPVAQQFISLPDLSADQLLQMALKTRDGWVWMGTQEGLLRYDPRTGQLVTVRTDKAPGAYLQNHVGVLYEDRAGTLWVGTLGGLYRLDPYAKPFRHLAHDPADPNSLSSNTVMAIWEDRDAAVWLGTLGAGLNLLDRRTGTLITYRHDPRRPQTLCDDRIWSLYEDRLGRLWVGTDAGLCVLDKQTRRFERYDLPVDALARGQPVVQTLLEDRQGRFWVGSYAGLYRLDPPDGAHVWRVDEARSLASRSVQALYEDRSGTLWIGLFGGALYRLTPGAAQPEHVPLPFAETRRLAGEGIWAIHEDTDGNLWLGSDQGLVRFDPKAGTGRLFTEEDGLPGSVVYAILEDTPGALWLSTNQGLVRFTPSQADTDAFRVYGFGDGLHNVEFNRRAAFRSTQGEILLGGMAGLTLFVPEQIVDNPYIPPIVLTRIQVSNRDTTRTIVPAGLDRLELSYRDYAFSLEFAALNYSNPSQNRYAYRLDGFDQGWIDAGSRRFAQYTNIPPGEYVFRVKGSNNDGLWNEEGATLALSIMPPFWQTWWFRMSVLALLVGLLAAAYRYRVNHLLAMERMRLRIAGDLHDDIGSNLSSIALLSDMVQAQEGLGDRERRHLVRISQSARGMVEALRDIVWSIDPKTDGTADLVQHMKDTAAALLGETIWTFENPETDWVGRMDMDVRRHVFLIYKEALHNIVRHAGARRVTVRLEEERKMFRLTISDDGAGFDAAAVRTGNGLDSMQERAARLGGTLTLQSGPGGGTTVSLCVPLRSRRIFEHSGQTL